MTHTKNDIENLFSANQGYARCKRTGCNRPVDIINLETALLTVYGFQTEDEKNAEVTSHSNGMGFNGRDAGFGSSLAKQILAGRWLSRVQLKALRRMLPRYWRQLGSMVAVIKRDPVILDAYPDGGEDDWA